MPKDTFYHLDQAKKQRLFIAIKNEFSQKSFADSAISEIVKAAGIPRGSFYQYFEDKLDCYLYFVGQVQNERNQIFLNTLIANQGNLLLATKHFFTISIEDVLHGTYADFYQTMITAHDFRLHRFLKHGSRQQLVHDLYQHTDLDQLRVNDLEDFRYLIEMILNIFFRSIGSYFNNHSATPLTSVQIQERCLLMLDWLANGVATTNKTN
ncbi:MAG: TetR family transcriptional regulator [Liquorilactobacillus ghanensis]|uniref:TetR/AcrR family transcriptional regulator n=1 Tax=Liquorilactobacillus ghanensis TaxID=399370 RepID=UPI0039E84346